MMDKKQVNDVVRQNVALLSKLSEQEVGMMPATEAPLPSVDQVKQIITLVKRRRVDPFLLYRCAYGGVGDAADETDRPRTAVL